MCSSFLAFVAFSNGKPDSTFPENALTGSWLIGRGFHSPWWDMNDILPGADAPVALARLAAAVKAARKAGCLDRRG